jgi:membrane protease YdiL (CAAX protease family)
MVAECLLWAVVLVGIGRLQQSLWPLAVEGLQFGGLEVGGPGRGAFARLVGYCGAGLYEEVLFRLLLLPVAVWAFGRLGCGPVAAGFWALVLSSTLFSAAHYVGPLGDTFSTYSFVFRAVAGVFFALLFLTRGFGIAAGTHFLYDLLVGMF